MRLRWAAIFIYFFYYLLYSTDFKFFSLRLVLKSLILIIFWLEIERSISCKNLNIFLTKVSKTLISVNRLWLNFLHFRPLIRTKLRSLPLLRVSVSYHRQTTLFCLVKAILFAAIWRSAKTSWVSATLPRNMPIWDLNNLILLEKRPVSSYKMVLICGVQSWELALTIGLLTFDEIPSNHHLLINDGR